MPTVSELRRRHLRTKWSSEIGSLTIDPHECGTREQLAPSSLRARRRVFRSRGAATAPQLVSIAREFNNWRELVPDNTSSSSRLAHLRHLADVCGRREIRNVISPPSRRYSDKTVTAGDVRTDRPQLRELTKVRRVRIDDGVVLLALLAVVEPPCRLRNHCARLLPRVIGHSAPWRVAMMWASLFTCTAFYTLLDSQGTDLAIAHSVASVLRRRLWPMCSLPSQPEPL